MNIEDAKVGMCVVDSMYPEVFGEIIETTPESFTVDFGSTGEEYGGGTWKYVETDAQYVKEVL